MIKSNLLGKNKGVIYVKDRDIVAEISRISRVCSYKVVFGYKVFVPRIGYDIDRHEVAGVVDTMEDAIAIVECILHRVYKGETIEENTEEPKKRNKKNIDFMEWHGGDSDITVKFGEGVETNRPQERFDLDPDSIFPIFVVESPVFRSYLKGIGILR